ncbi:hypothetical protein FS837_012370 [Tulasnella sp. UAMH 9824]|nr:hypothetical protein FS837_012370 [Tulasnella sp. UAMH 9824]
MYGDNDEEKEGNQEFDNHEKQSPHPHALISTVEDGSASPEHKPDKDPGLRSPRPPPQSDAQEPEPGDEQQGEAKGPSSHITDGESDQGKEEQKLALRESEFVVGLSHPNIVKFEGFVEDLSTQKVWLIFPWEEHGNLRDFLALGEWEIPERISLVIGQINGVTLGLDYLHRQQPPIYHGDLKSLNILVGSGCHALITDVGSARHLGSDHVSKQPKENNHKLRSATDTNLGEEHITLRAFFSATATTLTLTGSSYTLRWAAPELLQDDKPRLRSDIWALGWIAYEVQPDPCPYNHRETYKSL